MKPYKHSVDESKTKAHRSAGHLALLTLTFVVIIRTAWMSDSSISTLQCAVNFVHGNGLTSRLNERVIDFAHPLWLFLIAAGFLLTANVFTAALGLSIILSLATLWLLIKAVSRNFWPPMLAGGGLVLSKAYIDYSTSGLASPLSHFILVVGLLLGFQTLSADPDRRSPFFTIATLFTIYLSRPDLILLVAPFCIVIVSRSSIGWWRSLLTILLASSPIILWSAFSHFYYGIILPGMGVSAVVPNVDQPDRIQRGIFYLVDSMSRDPVTLAFILIGILLAIRQSTAEQSLAVGIICYLAYTVETGANSMSGYLLTAPVLVAAMIVARSSLSLTGEAAIAVVLFTLGGLSVRATILSGKAYSAADHNAYGIKDLRGVEFPHGGLINAARDTFVQPKE